MCYECTKNLFFTFRYAHEPELKEAAVKEWLRLVSLIDGLQPFRVPGTDLEVKAKGWPTNSDGNVQNYTSFTTVSHSPSPHLS